MEPELYHLFDNIASEYDDTAASCRELGLAIYEKICCVLSNKLFPESRENKKFPCFLKEDGCIYEELEDDVDITKTGEYMSHESVLYSPAEDYLFLYYKQSPYWSYDINEARICDYELKYLGLSPDDESYCGVYEVREKIGEEAYEDFVKEQFEYFFEYAAIELMDVMDCSPLEFYTIGDNEIANEYVFLKSYLLPYYLKLHEKNIEKEDEIHIQVIEKAIMVIQNMFHRGSIVIMQPELEAAYFVNFSGISEGSYYYPYGTSALKKSMLLAGKVIDSAILTLNEKYNFVPEEVVNRKE